MTIIYKARVKPCLGLYYSQLFQVFGKLLGRVDDLGIVGEDLSLQFHGGFLAVASLGKVDQTDGLLALLADRLIDS